MAKPQMSSCMKQADMAAMAKEGSKHEGKMPKPMPRKMPKSGMGKH